VAVDRARQEDRDSDLIDKLVHIQSCRQGVKGGRRVRLLPPGGGAKAMAASAWPWQGARKTVKCRKPSAGPPTMPRKKSLIRHSRSRTARTLHHEGARPSRAGKVLVRPATAGTGIIAAADGEGVFEALRREAIVVSKSWAPPIPKNGAAHLDALMKNQPEPPHGWPPAERRSVAEKFWPAARLEEQPPKAR